MEREIVQFPKREILIREMQQINPPGAYEDAAQSIFEMAINQLRMMKVSVHSDDLDESVAELLTEALNIIGRNHIIPEGL